MDICLPNRGIEANLEKHGAILEMRSLSTLKEMQQLTGRIVALFRFLARLAKRAHPFFRFLKKQINFKRIEKCKRTF